MRRLFVFALGALLVAACGSVESGTTTTAPLEKNVTINTAVATSPAPPIQAVDKIVDAKDFGEVISLGSACAVIEPDGASKEVPCSDEEEGMFDEAGLPAPEARARIVATLALSGPGADEALFVVYRSRGRGACWDVQIGGLDGRGWVPLDCAGDEDCPAVCADPFYFGEDDKKAVDLVAGTVSSEADEIEITFDDGNRVRYPLTGPLVSELPGQRVFLLEFDRGLSPRIELLRDGRVIASAPGLSERGFQPSTG